MHGTYQLVSSWQLIRLAVLCRVIWGRLFSCGRPVGSLVLVALTRFEYLWWCRKVLIMVRMTSLCVLFNRRLLVFIWTLWRRLLIKRLLVLIRRVRLLLFLSKRSLWYYGVLLPLRTRIVRRSVLLTRRRRRLRSWSNTVLGRHVCLVFRMRRLLLVCVCVPRTLLRFLYWWRSNLRFLSLTPS